MSPATHAAAAAVAASRFRNLGAALAVSFALHFLLDAIYHFEAFFELSIPGRWTYEHTMLVVFSVLTLLAAPVMIWFWSHNRQVWWFGCYAFLLCAVAFEPQPGWKLLWAALLSAIWLLVTPSALGRRWVACGFAAYLPDCLKKMIPALGWLHDAAHYESGLDLGDWLSLLGRGRWKLNGMVRAYDLYYQIGYALEILLEGAILLGCLYWLSQKAPSR